MVGHLFKPGAWIPLLTVLAGLMLAQAGTPPGARTASAAQGTTPQATQAATQIATKQAVELTKGKWEERKPMTIPRSETAAVVIDGLIYVPGGYGDEAALEAYDPEKNAWTLLKAMPDGRNHLMTTDYQGRLYVFGGAQAGSGQATRTTWVYDPAKNAWTVVAPMPEARAAGAAVALGDYLYVIGGVGSTQAVLRYDPAANTWKSLAALKAAREHTAAVALDDKIYALAGRWNNVIMTSVEIYDPEKDSWTPGTAMNEGRSGFGAAILDGKIVVAGGEVFSASGAKALTSAEIYDPDTKKWTFLPPMPVGVHGNPVASYEGEIFVLGGSDRAAGIDNRGRVVVYVP